MGGWRALAAFPPPPTVLSNQNQASKFTKTKPAIEQQNYIPPNSAYPPTVPSNQNQASNFRPTSKEQRQLLPASTLHLDLNPGIVGGRRATAPYPPPAISSNQDHTRSDTPTRATPAAEQHKMLPPNKAVEAEQRIQAEIKAAFEQEKRAEAIAAERENIEAERRMRAQREAMERNKAALAAREQAHILAEHQNRARASQAEPRPRAEMNAALAERNRAARLAAAREDMQQIPEGEQRVRAQWVVNERNRAAVTAARAQALDNSPNSPIAMADRAAAISAQRENTEGISEADKRANAQRDAIERNRALLEARAQARTTSQNPPISTADVSKGAATSAEREDIERVSEAEQHVRAQRAAMERGMSALAAFEQSHPASSNPPIVMANTDSAAAISTERVSEVEQRIRTPMDSMKQGKAVLAAYEQARPASSNPPISLADVKRAAALLAARDEDYLAGRDSLLSSPVPISERAPFSPTLDSSADAQMITTTTTSGLHSTVDQQKPRAARSVPELLRIGPYDPEWLELTKQEKYERQLAINRERYIRKREKERAATRSG